MNDRETSRYDMFGRVQTFGTDHTAAIAQDEPGFADNFRLPKTSSQASLLTTADAFLLQFREQPTDSAAEKAAKTALIARFVAHELPADSVTELADDRKAIDAAKDARRRRPATRNRKLHRA